MKPVDHVSQILAGSGYGNSTVTLPFGQRCCIDDDRGAG
jgi:hypothetical protein